MKKLVSTIANITLLLLWSSSSFTQPLAAALEQGFKRFANADQMKYAAIGFTVQDASGKTIFAHQENMGLAPASCQKIITAATAFDKLGEAFKFTTTVGYSGSIVSGELQGNLLIDGSGDPTMGSWRFPSQPDTAFFWQVYQELQLQRITKITGDIVATNTQFATQAVPGGWIYDDIGNYYGAGTWALNYHENQYDATFNATGNIGDKLPVQKITPPEALNTLISEVTLGAAGTGDNSVIYAPPYSSMAYATGTLGKTGKPFTVGGAIPFGEASLLVALGNFLHEKGITLKGEVQPSMAYALNKKPMPQATATLATYQSVTLDSVVYWFLQKSINLYGESLLKNMAMAAGKGGNTEAGSELIRDYWATKGIDRNALKIKDGSGLSPQNRVTTKSLVDVLQYAKKQPWFTAYHDALPLIHNIKMKSGTISGAKGYTGYITNKTGQEFTFALLVNNYSGPANEVVQNMWQLLDIIVNNK
jgi:D-alanyl-D-alanine carboxypeptidase/D-alanyl-D-alanine-endopeptidase (penicillin-binding protein 4)